MDLFTAGLGESPLSGGVVGQTFACVIAHQFEMLQKGDRFFFTHPPAGHPSGSSGLTDDQLVRPFFFYLRQKPSGLGTARVVVVCC